MIRIKGRKAKAEDALVAPLVIRMKLPVASVIVSLVLGIATLADLGTAKCVCGTGQCTIRAIVISGTHFRHPGNQLTNYTDTDVSVSITTAMLGSHG